MATATDDLKSAEVMIEGIIRGQIEKESAVQICHWLFSFNTVEKGFTVKCNPRNFPDVSFCIDRGHDCIEGKKIFTNIAAIRPPLEIHFRTKIVLPHFKTGNSGWYSIDGRKFDMDVIKKHIVESYEMRLNELNLVSNVSSLNNGLEQIRPQFQDNSHLPTKENFESTYRALARLGDELSLDAILDQIEINVTKTGLALKSNWRMITEKNIEIWSEKR